jgi:drug/metabolite transporter (DMT)-like permease
LISVDRQHPAGQSALIVGTLCALVAGALWGLVFIAPLVLPGASALDIASGRYVVYGLFSAVMLVLAGRATWPPTDVWRMAAKLTFVGSFVYYALTLLGIARAGAPLITLIIGVLPITMAVAGNFSAGAHAVAWSKLALPATIVLLGLGLVHVGEHGLVPSAASAAPLVGVLFGGAALAAWTWYGVRNAQYLAARSDVSASTMASLQGVTLLPLVVPLLGFSLLFAPSTSSALTAPWSFWCVLESGEPTAAGGPARPVDRVRDPGWAGLRVCVARCAAKSSSRGGCSAADPWRSHRSSYIPTEVLMRSTSQRARCLDTLTRL